VRDLKHLIYFEDLLQEANNSLVREAQSEGRIAIGSVCSQMPEPLINLPGCFSVRLRAPRTGSMEMGTYYMSSLICECCRAWLERAIEGGLNFLDCIMAADTCAQMNRSVENIEHLNLIEKDNFFVSYSDVPMKCDETALRHYVRQMKAHVLEPLHEQFGIDVSDAALKEAVEEQNEISRLITALGEYRKEELPRITGYEFAVFCLATFCCPKDKMAGKLKETLEEVENRTPDEAGKNRARVLMAGSEVDDPEIIRIAEEAGALVVADRFCFGSLPGRQEIVLDESDGAEDVLTQICRWYMEKGQCPRFMDTEKITERHEYIDGLMKEYRAEGIIFQQMKFCDYWGYERAHASHVMREQYGYPVLSVDRPYNVGNSGQLRTRFQAFVESLEIKKINRERRGANE